MTTELDYDRTFNTFVLPPNRPIRDVYKIRAATVDNGPKHWDHTQIVIDRHNEDGTVDEVFSYKRNYAMMKTFEPFRQLKDGLWKDYALISTRYTRFEVVDLQTGEICATEPTPTITQKHHDHWKKTGREKWIEEEPLGTEKPGWGFCPVEFYVPDYYENKEYDVDSPYEYWMMKGRDGEEPQKRYYCTEEELLRYTGQFALYQGCVWGDDSGGMKLRYIDLSRISEGIVTSDERFGYIQFAGKSLQEITFWAESGRAVVPVELYVDIDTGKAFKVEANWREDGETWYDAD